ncbi:hypothetical protein COZ22_00680 [bacterium (Candidatus Howlettbacteria) CG_4_10_14_3_um_filter_37_10]|nr:MAG: hypothetical protein COX25_05520 [bacterium (Candidatus Howlettbacteria) CG23_combo_of_CG06-09_8_20_14_all_37_9]PIY00249.1 MAG: hypothetical protein COZ22_00680 [bacterium (Candidatus Howlettbacteria) CG_4_10_14_3_um_filter_37_10]
MKIEVKNLLNMEEGNTRTGSLKAEIDLDGFKTAKPVEVDYELIRLEKSILGVFEARVVTEMECSRCLSLYSLENIISFEREFSKLPGEDFLPIKNFEIDVSEPLREEILLSLPIKPLCSLKCKGLCPNCGQNLNKAKCKCSKD